MAEAEQGLSSKLNREPPGKPDIPSPEPPARKKIRSLPEIIAHQLEVLRTHHRNVLETLGVEAVHKMRVATRRLQASLDLLEHEMNVRKLKRRLRYWRRTLSLVRNYDVFLEMLEKETATRGRTRREQFQLVTAKLRDQRAQTAAEVRAFLEQIEIDKISLRLGVEPQSGAFDPGTNRLETSAPIDITDGLSAIDERNVAGYAAERLDQRLAEFQALVAQSHPSADPADLHQLRIAAKRVRYLLEIVSQMGYGDASSALAWLRSLQDRIGDWHDLEALEEEIITIVSDHEFLKQHLGESSDMLQAAARLQKKKERLVSRLFPVRVPKHLAITSQRIARALRRQATRKQESVKINA
jgi:CHAD domain-containing protein